MQPDCEPPQQIEQFFSSSDSNIWNDMLKLCKQYSNVSNVSSNSELIMLYKVSSSQPLEIKFIPQSELFDSITEKMNQLHTEMCIDHDLALYVLYIYKWNREKLQNSYYDYDYEQFTRKNEALKCTEQRTIEGMCPVCENTADLYSNWLCSHYYCADCWQHHIEERLKQNEIFFPCLKGQECQRCPVLKSFVDSIAPAQSELYRKKICVNYSLASSTISYCSNQKCHYFSEKPLAMEIKIVECPCGMIYCFKCSREPHEPLDCEQVKEWQQLVNNDSNNQEWIKQHTKECPSCRNPIEKKVGCSKVKCICGCLFCFQCAQKWDETHSVNNDCPKSKAKNHEDKLQMEVVLLHQKTNGFVKEAAKNVEIIKLCMQHAKDQSIRNRLIQLKKVVHEAWQLLKWTQISIFLRQTRSIEQDFERQYICRLRELVMSFESLAKNIKYLSASQQSYNIEVSQHKRELFRKMQEVWLAAYRASIQSIQSNESLE